MSQWPKLGLKIVCQISVLLAVSDAYSSQVHSLAAQDVQVKLLEVPRFSSNQNGVTITVGLSEALGDSLYSSYQSLLEKNSGSVILGNAKIYNYPIFSNEDELIGARSEIDNTTIYLWKRSLLVPHPYVEYQAVIVAPEMDIKIETDEGEVTKISPTQGKITTRKIIFPTSSSSAFIDSFFNKLPKGGGSDVGSR